MNKYLRDVCTFPSDARMAWRADGAHGLWEELAERSVYRVARWAHYDLFERELSTVDRIPPPAGVEVRVLAPSDHAMLDTVMTHRRRAQRDTNPARRTLVAALRGSVVVGYSWWASSIDSALDFSPLVLPPDATFHGFVHVARAERFRGIASALFSAGESHLFDRGARVCWFLIKTTNVASARAARARWGSRSRHVARLSYWKLPSRTFRKLIQVEPS